MYKRIVRGKVREVFAQINAGNYMAMVDGLAPEFEYGFHGEHALGGRRTTRASMIAWWERIGHLLPGARFDVREVLVEGTPRHTRIAVRALVSGDLPGGERYENTVFQFMTLAWGKVAAVETIEDLQVLDRALAQVAAAGRSDALATPIVDPDS